MPTVAFDHRFGKLAARAADIVLFAFAIGLLAWKALAEVDATWDSLNYHLPFAARRAGLQPADAYTFQAWLEQCYAGMPALPYHVYGWLWRIAGTANAANLASVVVFATFCVVFGRAARAPVIIVAAALAAIPVVHVNLTSVYTDLGANLSFAAALVLVTLIVVEPDRPILPRLLGVLACAALAANIKVQFMALAGVLVPAVLLFLAVLRHEGRPILARVVAEASRDRLWAAALAVMLIAATYAPAVDNWITHGNPVYPVAVSLFGTTLPGTAPDGLYLEPQYLRDAKQPTRWALSVLDYRALGGRPLAYTIGQGNVPAGSDSLRMGGYLGLFALFNVVVFVVATVTRGGIHWLVLSGFAAMTVVVANLPGSHELRYYAFWMIYLVTMNLAYAWRWAINAWDRRYMAIAAVAALGFTGAVTGFNYVATGVTYVLPRFASLDKLAAAISLPQIYQPRIEDGKTYCLVNWGPYPMLGSPLLHPHRSFRAVEGFGGVCPDGATVMDLGVLQAAGAAQ
ncbi:MAG: hypothetical protein SFV21_12410 [Rhodospirillaceae bacterium]|nr:hypothetical protein [Rhodospirillaceae bacterium]